VAEFDHFDICATRLRIIAWLATLVSDKARLIPGAREPKNRRFMFQSLRIDEDARITIHMDKSREDTRSISNVPVAAQARTYLPRECINYY
jgi:hypothetical protein